MEGRARPWSLVKGDLSHGQGTARDVASWAVQGREINKSRRGSRRRQGGWGPLPLCSLTKGDHSSSGGTVVAGRGWLGCGGAGGGRVGGVRVR